MSRVIHTGDTHIGYRQYHSPVRRQDFLDAFEQVVEDAVAADVDAVVHAGDLFDDRRPALPDLLATIDILRELRAADVPFLAVVGNHEDTRRGQWLDLLETLDLAVHLDGSGTVVDDTTFYGVDYVPKSRRDRLEYDFDPTETAHAALVSHGRFTPFPHGDWDLEAVLDSASVDFDAVLLGDDHTHDTRRVDDTWATYCGSTERASSSERDPRGYNLVTFDDDVTITRRALDTREFVFLDVTLGSSEGGEVVRERIRESDVEDAVVIVTIDGDGGEITPADIEQFGQEQGALLTRVNDRREREADRELEVSFADPDDAVRERVREMGLSKAARTVDDIVRDDDVAASNIRSRVKSQVDSLLEEPDAFESQSVTTSSAADGEDADDQSTEDDTEETSVEQSTEASTAESEPGETDADVTADGDGADDDRDSSDARTTTMEDFL